MRFTLILSFLALQPFISYGLTHSLKKKSTNLGPLFCKLPRSTIIALAFRLTITPANPALPPLPLLGDVSKSASNAGLDLHNIQADILCAINLLVIYLLEVIYCP